MTKTATKTGAAVGYARVSSVGQSLEVQRARLAWCDKLIYGVSESGDARVAIVRDGSDRDFGGFVYERDVGVELPSTGQATYRGDYAGLRVFEGQGGIEYTRGEALIEVDFEDLNVSRAVEGFITERQIVDVDGDIVRSLPVIVLNTGSITDAGEISGTVTVANEDGSEGEYFAILSGDGAEEMVGVVVATYPDQDVTTQETGGFVLDRD